MEETVNKFFFCKLMHDTYLTIDVMMHIDRSNVLQFMYRVKKETRSFLQKNYISITNGFINEGLIVYDIKAGEYQSYFQLEKLYFLALK